MWMFLTVRNADPVRAMGIVDALHVILGQVLVEEQAVAPGDDFFLWPCSVTPQNHLVFMAEKIRGPHREAARILSQLGVRDLIEFGDVHGGTEQFERAKLPHGWQARRRETRDAIIAESIKAGPGRA